MRWLALVLVAPALAAARPVWRPPTESPEQIAAAAVAELAANIRARDAAAITKRLGAPFNAGPLWFPDAACTKQFGSGGIVGAKEAPALARCLAKLDLQLTTRRSSLRDGAILTAKPGFELELSFSTQTGLVRWLSSPAHNKRTTALPMLTAQAFEALRTHGTTMLDSVVATELDGERGTQPSVWAWLEQCLDTSGKVTSSRVITSSTAKTGAVLLRATTDWQFAPFKLRGTPTAACALSLVTYPAANAEPIEVLPPSSIDTSITVDLDDLGGVDPWDRVVLPTPAAMITAPTLEALRRRGTAVIKPDTAAQRELGRGKLASTASAKVCIDKQGAVSSVTLVRRSGSTAWDAQLEREVRRWLFRPYTSGGNPVPACAVVSFR